jgi:hypothetical protein
MVVIPITIAFIVVPVLSRHPLVLICIWLPIVLIIFITIIYGITGIFMTYYGIYTGSLIIVPPIISDDQESPVPAQESASFQETIKPISELVIVWAQERFVYIFISLSVFVLFLLLFLTANVAIRLLRNKYYNPATALGIVLQSYIALLLIMSIIYASLELKARGNSFHGMIPELPPLSGLDKDDPITKDLNAYLKTPFLLHIDALYFSGPPSEVPLMVRPLVKPPDSPVEASRLASPGDRGGGTWTVS